MTMDEETDDLELEIVSIRMDEEPIHKDSRKVCEHIHERENKLHPLKRCIEN